MSERVDVDQGAGHSYSAWHRMFEMLGIAAAYSMVLWLLLRFVVVISDAYAVGETSRGHWLTATVVGACLSAYITADLASGLVHWLFDRYGTEKTPIFGAGFVKPFRMHHVDPKDITRHDFVETNGNNCLVTCPPLVCCTFLPLDYADVPTLFIVAIWTFMAIFTFATNQFHKWAHTTERPPWVAWLQDKHIILPCDHHQIHHTFPYETHYCITTGWVNGFMVKARVWLLMELLIEKVSGKKPHKDPAPVEVVSAP